MVLPALFESTQKTAEVAGLQKFYSEMNQALMKLANDYGCRGDLSCTGIFSSGDATPAGDAIANYFNVATNCREVGGNCFASSYNSNYDGSGSTFTINNGFGVYNFITADGMSVEIMSWGNNCTTDFSINQDGSLMICGFMGVDVNGPKGPNRAGRDYFEFYITKTGIYPMGLYVNGLTIGGGTGGGWSGASFYWNGAYGGCKPGSHNGTQGWQCAGRIIDQGWVMNC